MLGSSSPSLVIVGDAKDFLRALKAQFPNVQVIEAANLDLDGPIIPPARAAVRWPAP
jgi:phospholipid N-methyltransferase